MGLLTEKMLQFLRSAEFLYTGTVDGGKPFVAPKFLISVENDNIYLADFVRDRTWKNLKNNRNVSLSVINYETLEGFQFNGSAEMLEGGTEYDRLITELERREISLSADRVLASLEYNRKSSVFEIASPENFGIIKVAVGDILRIGWSGKLERKGA